MVRRVLVVVCAVAAPLVGAGCHHGVDVPGPADGASLDFTSKATVAIDDTRIDPSSLHLEVGDAITVVNRGTHDHGLTSTSVDTGTLHPGESTVVFLTATGTIDAYDRGAIDHTLTIDVVAAPA